jgi:hypothetical protein
MRRLLAVVKSTLLILVVSCDPSGIITELPPRARPKSVMVCHNPSSPEHQKLCSEECYEVNRVHAVCWEMPYEWCEEFTERWINELCASVIRERLR